MPHTLEDCHRAKTKGEDPRQPTNRSRHRCQYLEPNDQARPSRVRTRDMSKFTGRRFPLKLRSLQHGHADASIGEEYGKATSCKEAYLFHGGSLQ